MSHLRRTEDEARKLRQIAFRTSSLQQRGQAPETSGFQIRVQCLVSVEIAAEKLTLLARLSEVNLSTWIEEVGKGSKVSLNRLAALQGRKSFGSSSSVRLHTNSMNALTKVAVVPVNQVLQSSFAGPLSWVNQKLFRYRFKI